MAQSHLLTLLIFLIGLVVGLLLTSVVTNYSEAGSGVARVGLLRTKAGQEILGLIQKYNMSGPPMSHQEVDHLDKAAGDGAPLTFGDEKFHNGRSDLYTAAVMCAHHTYNTHTYIHTCTHIHTYMYIHTYMHTHIHYDIHTCTHIHTYIHAYTYIHTYIHTYMHTYTQ